MRILLTRLCASLLGRKRPMARVFLVAGIAAVMAFPGYLQAKRSAMVDMAAYLRDLGYTPNAGLAGHYLPGSIIQTHEPGRSGARGKELPSPILFMEATACFPDLEPESRPFAMPTGSGSASSSLSVRGEGLASFLPSLQIGAGSHVEYQLSVEQAHIRYIPKGEMSRNFSAVCVQAYADAIAAGDQPGWFSTITEAVVADRLTFTITWDRNFAADARARIAGSASALLDGPNVTVSTSLESEQTTVIHAEGQLVIGYKARPMQPVEN